MTGVVEVEVEPLRPGDFAPFGEIVGPSAAETVSMGSDVQLWRTSFGVEGNIELMFGRYRHKPMRFHKMERHLTVTQSFLPLGGGQSVMVVAPPTDEEDREAMPEPGDVRAFHLDGTRGVMLRKGTWHARDRFPVVPPHADSAFLTRLLFRSLAMLFTSVAPSRGAYNCLWAVVINPMFWFGGAFYPLNRMPDGLQVMAQFIPLTHIVSLNRGLIEGELGWSHLGNLAVILAVGAAFFALALWSMRRRLIK